MAKAIGWLALILFDIPNVMFRGFVLSKLWAWFIVSLGVPAIGMAHAIGISILVGMLTSNPHAAERDDGEAAATKVISRQFSMFVISLTTWAFGALVAAFL